MQGCVCLPPKIFQKTMKSAMTMVKIPLNYHGGRRMDMVISAGKSRKNVDAYVILPPDAKNAVDLLISLRDEVGVHPKNDYIFARINSSLSPLSGNTDLKELVSRCPGLQCPERITSTSLRKYVATVTQIMDMTNSELESIARHLGHDVKTHKENYRLSHSTRELTVVAQLLIAVDAGCVNKWKGKQLADISVDELPDVEEFSDEEAVSSNDLGAVEDQSGAITDVRDSEASRKGAVEDQSGAITDVRDSEASRKGKRGLKRPWSLEEERCLKQKFCFYLAGSRSSVHNSDMLNAQIICPELSEHSLPQIRSKLNNMKLGKSK